ncbi:hypothetical protein K438DRAFT_1766798 [Mycena galopus ATCC 62051]|nr:hypothetical protein K438DRAFT_1766798 [Mycena galopus ATCC 62051]
MLTLGTPLTAQARRKQLSECKNVRTCQTPSGACKCPMEFFWENGRQQQQRPTPHVSQVAPGDFRFPESILSESPSELPVSCRKKVAEYGVEGFGVEYDPKGER